MGEDLAELINKPFPWQIQLNEILSKPPHPRYIYWLFDPFGNTGKSTYAKYSVFKKNAHMLSWDNQKDLFYARKVNQHKTTVFFDFTRSVPDFVDQNELFSSIESIKNGLLFSAKYESTDVITAKPHIVIFSNILPTKPSAISIDRWKIYRIGSQSKTLIDMDFQQCNDFIKDFKKHEQDIAFLDKDRKKGDSKSVYKGYFISPNSKSVRYYIPNVQLLIKYGD